MKLNRSQLRNIISEALEAGDAQDPNKLYEELLSLQKQYGSALSIFSRHGLEKYQEILDITDEVKRLPMDDEWERYGVLYDKIGPSTYNSRTGGHDYNNPYHLFAGTVRNLFDYRDRYPDAQTLSSIDERVKDLQGQFTRKDSTSQVDRVYGRKRTAIIHIPTGTTITSSTDRRGSLGT